MKKIYLIGLLFCCFFTKGLLAQYTVTGILIDRETAEPLVGGYLKMTPTTDSSVSFGVSNVDGSFKIDILHRDDYILEITYVGYQKLEKSFQINSDLDLGTIRLDVDALNLTEVNITATKAQVIQKGDTIQFNADAYATNPNANTGDLLEKISGFVINDGKMEVQGEKVTKILVNGKPYFGNDPEMALKNLQAAAINKVEVFNQSDHQEGEEDENPDGNTQKTINIVLKEEYNNTTFGNIYGGYGTSSRYNSGVNLNFFQENRRVNILGQFNNVNHQNFSSADLVGVTATTGQGKNTKGGVSNKNFLVPRKGGINTTNAGGINYQDYSNDKLEISASYFFNQSQNINQTTQTRDYFNRSTSFDVIKSTKNNSENLNHRFNGELRYRINKRNSILIAPLLTVQQNLGQSDDSSQTFSDYQLTNTLTNVFQSNFSAFQFSNKFSFTHKLKKRKRSLSFTLRNKLSNSNGKTFLEALNFNTTTTNEIILNQNSILNNEQKSYSIRLKYQEPLTKRSRLATSYTYGNEINDAEILTSTYNTLSEDYDLLEEQLSSLFNNDYQQHRGELAYKYRQKKINVDLGSYFQLATLKNTQAFPETAITNKHFQNVLPSFLIRYNIDKSKYLHLSFKSRTKLPRASDLQDVMDNNNPQRVRRGNPDLQQQISHTFELKYSKNNSEKNSAFYAFLQSRVYENYIGQELTVFTNIDTINGIVLEPNAELRIPVNLSGYFRSKAFLSYGVPLSKLKSNFNLNLDIRHRRIPSVLNGETIYTNTERLNLGIALSSNISPDLDFTLRSTTKVDFVQNQTINTQVFNQSTKAIINYIFAEHWQVNTNITHRYYYTFGGIPIDDFFLWNAGFQYRFLKDKKGELGISIFDIFNSNTSIQQSYNENYYSQRETLALQRYLMLAFRYRM